MKNLLIISLLLATVPCVASSKKLKHGLTQKQGQDLRIQAEQKRTNQEEKDYLKGSLTHKPKHGAAATLRAQLAQKESHDIKTVKRISTNKNNIPVDQEFTQIVLQKQITQLAAATVLSKKDEAKNLSF